jgi:hypothetical protein
MINWVKEIIQGLKAYSAPVVQNFRPAIKADIIPKEVYLNTCAWKYIVIHHSATADGKLNDWAAIKRYHTSYRIDGNMVTGDVFKQRQMIGSGKSFEKPWSDIGYHLGIEWDNGEVKVKIGRPWTKAGAHAGMHKDGKSINKFNREGLGICIVGNFDKTTPDKELWDKTVAAVKEICAFFNIPACNVLGHREAYDVAGAPRQKTCPGNNFDMDKLRNAL